MKKFLKKQQAVEIFKDIFSTLLFLFENYWSKVCINKDKCMIFKHQSELWPVAHFVRPDSHKGSSAFDNPAKDWQDRRCHSPLPLLTLCFDPQFREPPGLEKGYCRAFGCFRAGSDTQSSEQRHWTHHTAGNHYGLLYALWRTIWLLLVLFLVISRLLKKDWKPITTACVFSASPVIHSMPWESCALSSALEI